MPVLRFAILGLVAARPQTGYQLAQQMKASTDFFWTARHSQIYSTLAALEGDGQVTGRVRPGPGPRDTREYSVTDPGLAALRTWLVAPGKEIAERDEFVLKVANLWLLPAADAIEVVHRHRDEHAERLAGYEAIERGFTAPGPGTVEFASYATLRAGLGYERHRIAWCDWLLDELAGAQRRR